MTELKAQREAAKAAKKAALAEGRAREIEERRTLAQMVEARLASGDPGAGRGVFDVAVDFGAMVEKKRGRFLSLVRDFVPLSAAMEFVALAQPQPLDYPHADIKLRVLTPTEKYRLRACAKEAFTIDWLHEHVGESDVVYDVGANVGAYSLVAAMKPGSRARVVAFEPSYANVASLYTNIVLNGMTGRVIAMPVALSDRTGVGVFNLRHLAPGSARHALADDDERRDNDHDDDSGEADGPVYPQPVMTFRLDDMVHSMGLPEPNHIKLDVDGGELAVLRGGEQVLSSPALRTMLVEVSMSLSDEVVAALDAHGLRLQAKREVLNKAGEYGVWYGLFAR